MADVISVDRSPFAAELVSIDAQRRATFRSVGADGSQGEERMLPLNELVRWGHPVAPRAQTIVVLADGGRLVSAASWAGGTPVRLAGDDVVVLSGLVDEVRLPRRMVRGVVFAQQSDPRERERLEEQIRTSKANDDALLLTNGDRLAGELAEMSGGSLNMITKAGAVELPLSRVEAVILSNGRQPSAASRRPEFAVGLRDGSMLYAIAVLADEKELAMEVADEVKLRGDGVGDIVALQSFGGRFAYLSDLEPVDYRHVPYLSIEWPYRRDRNVLGEPLVVGGKRYMKGIGMHSASRLTYRLNPKYRRFDASVAIDDSAGRRGSVTFGVYLLRDGAWSEAYKSNILRGGDAPQPVSVDVGDAQGLTLTVDYADRGDEMDRAVWLDARLANE